jgi:hypothetical protein
MKVRLAAIRSAFISLLSGRKPKQNLRVSQYLSLYRQRAIALGMALLLLPLAQIDALAQQPWPQQSSPYGGQYAQPSPYANQQNQFAQPIQNYGAQPGYGSQPNYGGQQPGYGSQQPGYQGQPYGQQQYPLQGPGPQEYADQGGYPDQNGAQPGAFGQQPEQGFASQQLEQLVAPIALYPDALVAQILAASTYPAQVVAADHWRQQLGRVSPDQVAAAADAQASWDPSVKALTAFPQVLAMMDHDLQWTTDLGNAYYNQPQDVLSTIQVLRQRAENAGTLRSTPQQEVTQDQGYIQLAPTNPQVIYVPTYNPWYAYGAPINPYPGFYFVDAFGHAIASIGVGLVFGVGIALGAFFHAAFGWLGWGLNWHGGGIYYNHAPYYSHSNSVAHWGGFRGGYGGGARGGFGGNYASGYRPSRPMPLGRESAGNYRGESGGFGRGSNEYAGQGYAGQQFGRENGGRTLGSEGSGYRGAEAYGAVRGQAFAGNRSENYAYTRQPEQMRPQYSAPQQGFSRGQTYGNGGYGSGGFRNQQSFANERSYSAPRNESYGGSHAFGGGHGESYHAPKEQSFKAPKEPKMSGGHSGGGGHGGGGHGGGGKHH